MSEIYNHDLYNKPIGGEAISFIEYGKLLQRKFKDVHFTWEGYYIELPLGIEFAKVSI